MTNPARLSPWAANGQRWERQTPSGEAFLDVSPSWRRGRWGWRCGPLKWSPPEDYPTAEKAREVADRFARAHGLQLEVRKEPAA